MSKTNKAIIEGTVISIGKTQEFPSGFTKRILVVKTNDDKYPQEVPIEFVKERTAKLDKLAVGDAVLVETDVRGNEYNGKWYVSLTGWRVESEEKRDAPAQPQGERQNPHYSSPPPAQPAQEEEDDDIPF